MNNKPSRRVDLVINKVGPLKTWMNWWFRWSSGPLIIKTISSKDSLKKNALLFTTNPSYFYSFYTHTYTRGTSLADTS